MRFATAHRANDVPRVPGFTEDHLPHTILHPTQFRDIWNGEGHSPERELAAAVLDAAASDLRNYRYARRRRRQRMYWQTYQWVQSDSSRVAVFFRQRLRVLTPLSSRDERAPVVAVVPRTADGQRAPGGRGGVDRSPRTNRAGGGWRFTVPPPPGSTSAQAGEQLACAQRLGPPVAARRNARRASGSDLVVHGSSPYRDRASSAIGDSSAPRVAASFGACSRSLAKSSSSSPRKRRRPVEAGLVLQPLACVERGAGDDRQRSASPPRDGHLAVVRQTDAPAAEVEAEVALVGDQHHAGARRGRARSRPRRSTGDSPSPASGSSGGRSERARASDGRSVGREELEADALHRLDRGAHQASDSRLTT